MYVVISGLSLQCSNPYTTHRELIPLLVKQLQKDFVNQNNNITNQQHLYYISIFTAPVRARSSYLILIVQTNISDLQS